jgi:deoxyribose-phosphate aldolase
MDTTLLSLAQDVLSRLEGRSLPTGRPQLLACSGGSALLRGPQGLQTVALEALPASLDLSPLLDHTLLKADARSAGVDALCDEALAHSFASVCVNPLWVARSAKRLQGSPVKTCTVVGFPLGATTSGAKGEETRLACGDGATEIDLVLAIGAAKDGDWDLVRRDYRAVREAAKGAVVKVILETCLLTDEEKVRACQLAVEEGLDFVKTSTGFSTGGATEADVALMRATVGTAAGVKASGAIRNYETALAMVKAGATRLGVSASLAIVGAEPVKAGGGY